MSGPSKPRVASHTAPLAAWQPDVTSNGVGGEDEGADGQPVGDVKQRRVAALMGCKVVSRESDNVSTAMAMDREVDKAVPSAAQDVLGDEARRQHSIAALARNVVNAILGEYEVASEEANAARRLDDAGTDDRSVLVAVTRK